MMPCVTMHPHSMIWKYERSVKYKNEIITHCAWYKFPTNCAEIYDTMIILIH